MNSSARQPNDHVLDLALDYIEGRLDPEQTDDVRQHLRQCDECRADFDHATLLRGSTIEAGLRHIHSQRLVEISEGAHASVEENVHLDSCSTCHRELQWATDLELPPELLQDRSAAADVEPTPSGDLVTGGMARIFALPRLLQWSSVLGAAAVLLIVVQPWGTDNSAIVQMAEFRALPVVQPEATRGENDFASATAAYAAGDYEMARTHFSGIDAADPNFVEAQLYLGSALLILGDVDSGRDHVRRALDLSDPEDIAVRGAAHFLLANTYLQRGDAEAARRQLESTIELNTIFVDEAQAQLQQLDAVR